MALITRTSSRSGMSPVPQPTGISLQFSPPFLGKAALELDLSTQEVFTLKTFKELIDERHQAGIPYYVAATKDTKGLIKFFDATSLMTAYFDYKDVFSPTSRLPFSAMEVYVCKPNGKGFEKFCEFYQLHDGYDHYAKFLLAADPSLPDHSQRGRCRYYLAGHYQHEVGDLKQAEFWYNKGAEDNYFAAHLTLAEWHELGTYHPKNAAKALEEYQMALALIQSSPDYHVASGDEYADMIWEINAKINSLNIIRAN